MNNERLERQALRLQLLLHQSVESCFRFAETADGHPAAGRGEEEIAAAEALKSLPSVARHEQSRPSCGLLE